MSSPEARNRTRGFTQVAITHDPELTITYRSGLCVYQESLVRGEFIGRGWSGSGFTNPEDERIKAWHHPMPQAFWLEAGGQLLRSGWRWGGLEQRQEDGGLHACATLEHQLLPITVRVHSHLDGTPVLARWLEIVNGSDQPLPLSQASPWSGVLETGAHDMDRSETAYSVGYFRDSHWGNEGDFEWHRLPAAGYRIDGRYRRGRHRHPFFVLRNHQTGTHYIGTLGWSAGYAFEFDVDEGEERSPHRSTRLWFRAGPDAPAPLRVLAPGETVTTPTMHLGLVNGDLDETIHALHDHLRASVLPRPPYADELRGLVTSGVGPEQPITLEQVFHGLETAAAAGAEVFIIDAIWYFDPDAVWWSAVGDWQVNGRGFPNGLDEVRERTHAAGLLFGLWMDAERLGSKSRIVQEHPDWIARRYDGEPDGAGWIDLTRPEAVTWLEGEVDRLITEHKLDLFRLDWNVGNQGPGAWGPQHGLAENSYWRYYEALYGMFGRLRQRHPRVIFQNCAGGGGRTDVGLLPFFEHTWVTDWQIAPRSISITNGMTMALPPEYVDCYTGMGQAGQRRGELDLQARRMLFGHPTVSAWSHLCGLPANSEQMARIRHVIDLYKRLVRPMQRTSRIYHHTPELPGFDPHGWAVLELASADRQRAIAGLFRLSDPAEPAYRLCFRGLDLSRRYAVTWDNSGDRCILDGYTLTKEGVPVRLEAALTSELLIVEAIEDGQG